MSLRFTFALVGCTLLLAACGAKPPTLPADEILRRAVIRSNTTESVAVSVSGSFDLKGEANYVGTAVLQGAVIGSGRAWSADTSFELSRLKDFSRERSSGRVVLQAPGNGLTYIQASSLEGALIAPIKQLLGDDTRWWTIETPATAGATISAPDPLLLSRYADVIVPVGEATVEETEAGDLYHLRVGLKPEALAALSGIGVPKEFSAEGDLWVNASTFDLQRSRWKLQGVPQSDGVLSFEFDATFGGYGLPHPVAVPAGSASTLPLDAIFATFSL